MMSSHKGTYFFVGFAALIIIIAGLKAASEIVVPFMLSMFIAIICTPLLTWLTKHKVPTWLAIILVISLMVFSIGSLGIFVWQLIRSILCTTTGISSSIRRRSKSSY